MNDTDREVSPVANPQSPLPEKKNIRFELLKGTCLGAVTVAAIGLAVDGGMRRAGKNQLSLKDGFLEGMPYVLLGGMFNGIMSYVDAARHNDRIDRTNDKIDTMNYIQRIMQEKFASTEVSPGRG